MKKVAIAVAVVVVLLALPFLTGLRTESHIRQRISTMSDNPVVVADLSDYERGWFTSSARIELGLSQEYIAQLESDGAPLGSDFPALRVPVLIEIAHGPLAIKDGVHFGMSKIVARSDPEVPLSSELREQLGMPYLFELRGRAGFGGGFEFDADVPPVDYADGSNEVDFSGLLVEGTLDGDHVVADGSIESFDYQSPLATAAIDQLRVNTDYRLRPNDIALGTGEVGIERIVVASPMLGTEPLFNATGLRFSSNVALDEAATLMRIVINYGADTVVVGADVTLTETDFGLTLADLDAAAMQAYYATIYGAGSTPRAGPEAVLAELSPVLEQLLVRGPSLTLDPIRFSMNGEPFSANVRISTDPAALPSGPHNFQDPTLWLALASVNAEADVSKVLAQSLAERFVRQQMAAAGAASGAPIPEDELNAMAAAQAGLMLVALSGQGFLENSGENYTATLEFSSGELTVNGTSVPLGL
jgi:uncharacterized protein YdgA (DUF945 family)